MTNEELKLAVYLLITALMGLFIAVIVAVVDGEKRAIRYNKEMKDFEERADKIETKEELLSFWSELNDKMLNIDKVQMLGKRISILTAYLKGLQKTLK